MSVGTQSRMRQFVNGSISKIVYGLLSIVLLLIIAWSTRAESIMDYNSAAISKHDAERAALKKDVIYIQRQLDRQDLQLQRIEQKIDAR